MVVLSLRGAADGLSLVVPHADPQYYAARPRIAIPADTLLAKDGQFGLHPNLAPLLPLWTSGKLAAVHATGLPAPNRSHFAAMEEVEDADPGSSARVGWLNRLIGLDADAIAAAGLQRRRRRRADLPRRARAVPLRGRTSTTCRSPATTSGTPRDDGCGRSTPCGTARRPSSPGAMASTFRANSDFQPVRETAADPANGASYGGSDLGEALRDRRPGDQG